MNKTTDMETADKIRNMMKAEKIEKMLDDKHQEAERLFTTKKEQFINAAQTNPTYAIEHGSDLIRLQEEFAVIAKVYEYFLTKESPEAKLEFIKEYIADYVSLILSDIGTNNSTCKYKTAVEETKLDARAGFVRDRIGKGFFVKIAEELNQ